MRNGANNSSRTSVESTSKNHLWESLIINIKDLLAETDKEIIGFDLVEVAPGEDDWDGNVGARMLFHMCGVFAKSQKMNVGNQIKFNK